MTEPNDTTPGAPLNRRQVLRGIAGENVECVRLPEFDILNAISLGIRTSGG